MATMMPEFTDTKALSKHLAGLPFMRDQEAKLRAEVARVRRDTAAKLRAVQERRTSPAAKKTLGALTDAQNGIVAAEAKAKQLIEDARSQLRKVQRTSDEFFGQCDLDQRRLENTLQETAAAEINAFIEWAFVAQAATYKEVSGHLSANISAERDPITDAPKPTTRRADIQTRFEARIEAISKAIDDAQALRLAVDVDVAAAIERIRESIPSL